MKAIIITLAAVLMAVLAMADTYVDGYFKQDGTYVAPHVRSAPDNSYNNNYNTQGNYNPYNGRQGTERPTYTDRTPEYNQRTYGDTLQRPSEHKQRRRY